jgi:hypothetical protein
MRDDKSSAITAVIHSEVIIKKTITMKCLSLILVPVFALISLSLPAQTVVNPDFRIFPSADVQSEVHVSVNKPSPANIVVSANTLVGATLSQSYYYSIDGGITWNGSDLLPSGGTGRGDPSTDFDASGRAYLTTISPAVDGYMVQYSDDRGVDWSNQARGTGPIISDDFDKEMMVTVDEMQTSPYVNNFYCAWTDFSVGGGLVKVNRSTDRTNTFSAAITLSQHYGQGTSVQTGPNGEVYVAWADYSNGTIPAQNMGFAVSLDGGGTYASSLPFAYAGIRTSFVGIAAFGNTRVNDYPVLAVDKSCGAHRGRIYIVYPTFNGTQAVIQVRSSDNHGTTWTAPTTISIPGGYQNWFPWISVDDLTGLVNVAYYSMDVSPTSFATDTYVAYSTNGGATWQNVKASSATHITAPIPAYINGYAGDYIGLASFGGVSYAAWGDSRTGNWQIYMAKINYNIPTLSSSQTNLSINAPATISGAMGYQAFDGITVSNTSPVTIASGANVSLTAGNSIIMDPGFSASSGSVMTASIASISACTTPGTIFYSAGRDSVWQPENNIFRTTDSTNLNMFAYPNPTVGLITIGCLNKGYSNIYLQVYDASGRQLATQDATLIDATQARFIYDASRLTEGIYFFTIITDGIKHTGEFLKVSK